MVAAINKIVPVILFLLFLGPNNRVTDAPIPDKIKAEILVGAHLPLSGSLAMQSIEQKWAYEKAVEDINKAGGIYVREFGRKLPVRLIVLDDETNPVKAAEKVEHLITRKKVDILLSGFTGAYGVLPGLITAEKYQKYYHGSVERNRFAVA